MAKSVKKAYIGIGGKAKLWYVSGPPVTRYGYTQSDLSSITGHMFSAKVGNYAVFATTGSGSVINFYDTSLTRYTNSSSSYNVYSAASLPSYAVFTGNSSSAAAYAFNSSRTRSAWTASSGMPYSGTWISFCSTGNKIITTSTLTVYMMNNSLTWESSISKSTLPSNNPFRQECSSNRYPTKATFNGEAVWGGGYYNDGDGGYSYYNTIASSNDSLTFTQRTALNQSGWAHGTSSSDYYCIYATPSNPDARYGDTTSLMTAYNTSWTRSRPAAMTYLRSGAAYQYCNHYGLTNGGKYCMFAGGRNYGGTTQYSSNVYLYDQSLTLQELDSLQVARSLGSDQMNRGEQGQRIGNYCLFAGGYGSSGNSSKVDVYQIQY